jgi:hypothetical protein
VFKEQAEEKKIDWKKIREDIKIATHDFIIKAKTKSIM